MKKFWIVIYFIQLFVVTVKCNIEGGIESKNKLPYFRRNVDENLDNLDKRDLHSDDLGGHVVSLLFHNVKEIFSDNDEINKFSVSPFLNNEILTRSTTNYMSTVEEDPLPTNDIKGYGNMSLTTIFDMNELISVTPRYDIKKAKQSRMLILSENSLKKSEQKVLDNNSFILVSSLAPEINDTDATDDTTKHERSCIFCNNVMHEDCGDPKNKLIPSVVCKHEDDLCYSLHTPFGVINRGCYNIKRNLTIYVCACNLCNYFSIEEMPYIFSNKREWVHNVIELSRIRSLRKSAFKDMACLSCEVNMTSSKVGIMANENCLDGNIGSVPTQVCEDNEICAVKTIKDEGYIWRGCVRSPLYNYWWNICNRDLCNYDSLVSIYDYL